MAIMLRPDRPVSEQPHKKATLRGARRLSPILFITFTDGSYSHGADCAGFGGRLIQKAATSTSDC